MQSVAQLPTRRAAIYVRVSTVGQEEDGTGLSTQEAACLGHAPACNGAVDDAHIYREVHTGTELWERPQLQRLREVVRRREVDVVICYAIDRLSRDPVHMGVILSEAEHAGVGVVFVTEPLDNSPEGQLIRFVRGYAAKVEHEKIRERAIRGRRARVEAGKMLPASRPLYGYRWRDAERTALEVDSEAAPIIRRIFTEAAEGGTLRGIAARLTEEGIPTPARVGSGWFFSTVARILKNRDYTGQAVGWKPEHAGRHRGRKPGPTGPAIPLPVGTVPPLVDVPTFEAVQARLQLNKEQASRNNSNPEVTLLRGGYVRCGYCDSAMNVRPPERQGGRPLYICIRGSRGNGWKRCLQHAITAPILDAAVWDRVEQVLTKPDVIARELAHQHRSDPTAADLAAVERAVAVVSKKQRNLVQNLALVQGSAAALVAAQLEELEADIRRLNGDRETILQRRQTWKEAEKRLSDLEAWCRQVASRLKDLSYVGKRTALAALGVQARVWRSDHEPRYEITMSIPLDGQYCVQSTKKRASLHCVRGEAALEQFERGGLEVLEASPEEFRAALLRESHTLKRALTDPGLFSGIGNAYSDEILHRARLSPFGLTRQLESAEIERLYRAACGTLRTWIVRLREEVGEGFPEKVTAFHPAMAVHGRYRQPCPDCGSAIQRIAYAENECDYCARCQTGGRLLADRALSRLLRTDWPRTIDELEGRLASAPTSR